MIRHLKRLDNVDERLWRVLTLANTFWQNREGYDLMVVEGLRSQERQDELYAQGRTKPGKIVTWTRNSKHCVGKAMDVAPVKGSMIPWDRAYLFDAMAACILDAAKQLDVPLRWGGNFDGDAIPHEKGESDSPHFELMEVAS